MTLNTKYFYSIYKKNGGVLDYSIYHRILNSYFKKVTDKILLEGVGINLRSNLGFLSIATRKKKIKIKDNNQITGTVDWGESNKLKAQILKEGKLPLENYKNIKGEIIGNNNGVPWLCYFLEPTYYQWSFTSNMYLKNSIRVKFEPSWTNKRKIGKLIDKENDLFHI